MNKKTSCHVAIRAQGPELSQGTQRFINYDEGAGRWCRYFSLIEHVRLPDSEDAVPTGTCSGHRVCVAASPVQPVKWRTARAGSPSDHHRPSAGTVMRQPDGGTRSRLVSTYSGATLKDSDLATSTR
jgi:hypothetical protein